ncbi:MULTISPECIES: hypothetical protein [unclassified Pantoea]|uniref:hypothetical protein n=1 Tax=unclassified Pantoea TaxID=2630326 RepID=UPI0012324621|nr:MULTISPECIES: hypothetical protein [unclassified Pantoea]KAA5952031.1 hypothetical protein F3I55_18240 [Pantoea sp. VH_24]KAA5953439.1 hypothetical protein F3I53_22410 [Pantoea sp. VH_16]KAA5961619.1 hypothetical protein F3I54_19080 [Pantoea sp. VH_18]KAA5993327.1 hypothetical protein F3I46_18715 [Pantoea sp. M_1]KAA5998091.1 hypothetical protein F3I45_19360 [Pantoea sp. F_7]
MKKAYAVLINDILQQYHFDAEHSGTNDTLSLGMAFMALQFAAKYSGDTVADKEISQMIADCRKGIIPRPISGQRDVIYF